MEQSKKDDFSENGPDEDGSGTHTGKFLFICHEPITASAQFFSLYLYKYLCSIASYNNIVRKKSL